ncbi:MAG TPA: hypothetical protein VGB09_06225, partial [Candidatus Binatia bacterium]
DGRQPLQALVYVAELERRVPLPNAEYKRLIVEGAKHWRLPAVYLTMLQAIETAQETALQRDPSAQTSADGKLSDESP